MAISSFDQSNIIFHIRPVNGIIKSYGSAPAINVSNVYAEPKSGLFNQEYFKPNPDIDKGVLIWNGNPLSAAARTRELSISYWIYLDTPKSSFKASPLSMCRQDDTYHSYTYDKYRPIGEFILTPSKFVFDATNHYTGSNFERLIPNAKWTHVLLTFKSDPVTTSKNQMNLFVNGNLASVLYTKEGANASSNSFLEDFMNMTSGVNAVTRLEFPGAQYCKSYRIADFTILNKVIAEEPFEVPSTSLVDSLGLALNDNSTIKYESTSHTGSDPSAGSNQGANTGFVDHDPFAPPDTSGSISDVFTTKRIGSGFSVKIVVPKSYTSHEFGMKMNVIGSNTVVTVNIPFPYKKFTEMGFFLTKMDGTFIPEYYYDRINETQIKFKNGNPLNIGGDDEIRFTFCHKHGFYAVNKYEESVVLESGKYSYQFHTPYNSTANLQQRVRVFYDRQFLYPNMELYKFDSQTGIIKLNSDFVVDESHLLSFLCFYTGTKQNDHTITRLPMSGYIEFNQKYVDRVYDKDLFSVFLNGRMVDRKDIIDISNRIHKISTDLQTRYNLEVMNLSPRINSLVPYFKEKYEEKKPDKFVNGYEFPCTIKVYYPDMFIKRFYVDPDILNPVEYKHLVPDNLEWYITLLHHGLSETEKAKGVTYKLKFFRDNYMPTPEYVNVIGQIRLKGNEEQYYPDSPTAMFMGQIPAEMNNAFYDTPIMSIKAKLIFDNDTTFNGMQDSIDGIMCRMEINPTLQDKYHHLYYELDSTDYEHDTQVGIFEWVISDEVNGKGNVYYRKTISMLPYNPPVDNTFDEEE